MSDQDVEFPAFGQRSVTIWVILMSILVVPLSVLLVAPVLDESGEAAATVGFILAEALILYVGYGALAWVTSPSARELLMNT